MQVLSSKSFWSSVAVIVAMGIVSVVPELQSSEDELITAFTAIGLALVAGHKAKDILLGFVEAFVSRTSVADELNELDNDITIS